MKTIVSMEEEMHRLSEELRKRREQDYVKSQEYARNIEEKSILVIKIEQELT